MRRVVVSALFTVVAAVAVAGTSARPAEENASRAAAVTPSPTATARAAYVAPSGPTEPPAREDPATIRRAPGIRGLFVPIAGHAIPTDPLLLPDSPRAYRAGVHEGIDFAAPAGTPVLAAADGVIVRIDHDYTEPSLAAHVAAIAAARDLGYTPGATLDMLRGRQVWIDHGHGLVTRYCHLSSVTSLPVGAHVRAGERIGAVGSSGLPEGGPHLHFEIRVGADFLGDGLTGAELQRAVDLAFR